ncbi:hypothetical protein SCATT_p17270 (plasmid) [Streptantibioticus cattleyicolor NRRL 8057 = DSM 46488]|uniref:Uncharacterized protein n=1 Tax=Streptantibioticus cattleyicolor (strain ATCC 35852 / DSM 46488 / JCM 4925 / NBRC 14057 / NRRL 8057) TaxID=1003195 RepID=G8XI14_STREN|nr:hypothetical protein SCATT_p17270 [Streptantibioticus cattleyicolor NRRL 8057 = DSM 46488]
MKISGSLETKIPEIFAADYDENLQAARSRLLDELGDFGV